MSIPGDPSSAGPAQPSVAPAPEASSPGFSVGGMFVALGVVVIGHVLAVGGAFLAGRLAQPSAGGGHEDVAAVVGVLVLAEIALATAALVAVIVYVVKGRRDRAVGVALGWLVGPIATTLIALAQANSSY